MSAKVNEGDYLVALRYNLPPILVLILIKSLRDNLLSFFSEAHDLLSNRTSPTRLLLMEVIEDPYSSTAVTIVSDAFGEDGH